MITLQSGAKCRLIDQCATRAIDQAGARLHFRKTHSVNKIARLIRQRAVETHVIRSRQQRIKRDRLSPRLFDNFWGHEWIVSQYLHFEREASLGEDAADHAETDYTDAFARKLGPDELGWLPLAGADRAIGLRKVAA